MTFLEEGQTVVCLYEKQFDYFTDNIKKIGPCWCDLNSCILDGITFEPKFKELTGTVAFFVWMQFSPKQPV